MFIGRYLGPEDLGLYRIASTIYGITTLIFAIGMPTAIVKYIAEFKENNQRLGEVISCSIITSILLGSGAFIILFLLAGNIADIFKMPGLEHLIKLLSFVFPFSLSGLVLLGMLNGFRDMKKYALAVIIQNSLTMALTVILIFSGYGVSGAVMGIVISTILGCLFTLYLSKKYLICLTFNSFIPTAKSMLIFGGQTSIGDLVNTNNFQPDIILVGILLGAKEVGYYSVASGFSKFFRLVPNALKTITYPATVEYWKIGNLRLLNKMIDKSMRYTAIISVLLALAIGFFAEPIVTIIFGIQFIDATLPLRILVIGMVISGIFNSISSILLGTGRADLGVKVNATGAITNVLLCILLIPVLGIMGAAASTAISLTVVSVMYVYFAHNLMHLKINFRLYIKMIAVILTVVLLSAFEIPKIYIYITGSVTLILYSAIIFLFLLNKDEKDTFKTFVNSKLFHSRR